MLLSVREHYGVEVRSYAHKRKGQCGEPVCKHVSFSALIASGASGCVGWVVACNRHTMGCTTCADSASAKPLSLVRSRTYKLFPAGAIASL